MVQNQIRKTNITTRFNLGTFEGFNFRDQCAISEILTTDEVINWDHDGQGEAEFWPAGDNPLVARIFDGQTAVTGSELLQLDGILAEIGADSDEDMLRVCYARSLGTSLEDITPEMLDDLNLHIFIGSHFIDLRQEAAYELFELYYPECYQAWEKSCCDGLIFDPDRFLESPGFSVQEIRFGDRVAVLICPE